MRFCFSLLRVFATMNCLVLGFALNISATEPATVKPTKKIVLVAGEMVAKDKLGHHDYNAGCDVLHHLLEQTPGVTTVTIRQGWPEDESVFAAAAAVVFYTDGGGKQAFLKTPERVAQVQKWMDAGVGLVCIHQAIDFPEPFVEQAKSWLGGVYVPKKSGRGHWNSQHVDFPQHPVTRGVEPWKINDGWLNKLEFVEQQKGVTALVWSGKEHAGSRAGLDNDIVGWVYERPNGGRAFGFSGLDAHSAWSLPGMRQLVVNGVLWTANLEIPSDGAPDEIAAETLEKLQTPR